jgi:hypothetical protein
MRNLGEAKANIAIAHSLLDVAYVLLKERRPYQEPDPKQMHELEKAKLVRHHAKRLRQLGADNELVEQLVARLSQPDAGSPAQETATQLLPLPLRRASPAKVCYGALGFRARQTRKTEYSIGKSRDAQTLSPKRSQSKPKQQPATNDQA